MKYIRSNNCNFLTKELRKTIVNRLKLELKNLKVILIVKEIFVSACSAKVKDNLYEKLEIIEMFLTIEHFGKLSVQFSWRRLLTKNVFWTFHFE